MSAASVETIDMLLHVRHELTAQTADEDDLGTLRALITSNAPINESLRGEKKVVRPCVACESKQRLAVSLDYLRYSYFVACYLPRAASDDTTPKRCCFRVINVYRGPHDVVLKPRNGSQIFLRIPNRSQILAFLASG